MQIFVALDGTGPAENPDIERTEPLHAVLSTCVRERRWTDMEKEKLGKAVRQQVQERWVQELLAEIQK